MTYERISLEQKDGIAVLKFNHPEVLNAIGAQMLGELTDAVSQIAAPDSTVRCVLLTGEGRSFSAGANLSDTSRKQDATKKGGTGSSLRTGYHPLFFAAKIIRRLKQRPYGLASLQQTAGYVWAFVRRIDRVIESDVIAFLRNEQKARLKESLLSLMNRDRRGANVL